MAKGPKLPTAGEMFISAAELANLGPATSNGAIVGHDALIGTKLDALTFRGAWSGATAYAVNDVANKGDGVAYKCIVAHTNQTPPNGTYWTAISSDSGTNDWVPHLGTQNSGAQTNALAMALLWLKGGRTDTTRRNRLVKMLKALPGTEVLTAQPLNPYRQIGLWVTIADMIAFDPATVCANGQTWGAWCDTLFTATINSPDGGNTNWETLHLCGEECGANWGAYARHAWIALALYRNNQTELNRALGVFKLVLGDASATAARFTETGHFTASGVGDSWCLPNGSTGYPAGARPWIINDDGNGTDPRRGVNVEDVARGTEDDVGIPYVNAATYAGWDGHYKANSYQAEALDAMLGTAILLKHANYDPLSWSNGAIVRNAEAMLRTRNYVAPTWTADRSHAYLLNYLTGQPNHWPTVTEGTSGVLGRAWAYGSWLAAAGSTFMR